MVIASESGRLTRPNFNGFPVSKRLQGQFDLDLTQLAPAIGAAVGLIVDAQGNLLDGFKVVGRSLAGANAFRAAVGAEAEASLDVSTEPSTGTDDSEEPEMFGAEMRNIMPFPMTEPSDLSSGSSVKPAVERLGGHGIAGKSSEIDAMVGSGQRLFAVMTVILVFLIAAVAIVVSFR